MPAPPNARCSRQKTPSDHGSGSNTQNSEPGYNVIVPHCARNGAPQLL
ncbi:MAG: hypothetical protein ACREUU_14655 [Gammaproteobacteria bacterium]